MSYSIDPTDSGCYPGTTVLINKLNLQTQEALDRAERVAFSLRAIEIEKEQNSEPFTLDLYPSPATISGGCNGFQLHPPVFCFIVLFSGLSQ